MIADQKFGEERAAVAYLDALDAGDLDAIAAMWERAADDPGLYELLDEINKGLEDTDTDPGTHTPMRFRAKPL